MNQKRGQVTIFIILAIIIALSVGAYFIFKDSISGKSNVVVETSELHTYVMDCFENTLDRVLLINSLQGGYYQLTGEFLMYSDDSVYLDSFLPYYLIDETSFLPSKDILEEQISLGINKEIVDCLDFSEFPFVEADYDSLDSKIEINSEIIIAELTLPLTKSLENNSFVLEDFKLRKDSSYFSFYEFAEKIVSNQIGKIDEICLTCLRKDAEESGYNLTIDSLVSEEEYVLVNTISKADEPYYYGFAYKFNRGAIL